MYSQLRDEILINMYNDGDEEAANELISRYLNLIGKRATSLFLIGGEKEDLIQEGLIGLLEAISSYDYEKGRFSSFASLCINRQMLDAINASRAKKNIPLNESISLDAPVVGEDNSLVSLMDTTSATADGDPERLVIERESMDALQKKLKGCLSTFEQQVYEYYIGGMNYKEIAACMGKSSKSIDNALNRIKTKAQEIIDNSHSVI